MVISRTRDREADLVGFYESFFSQDLEHFSISREYAPGLYGLLDHLPPSGDLYIKGQSVGPVTFLTNIMNRDGKSTLFDPSLWRPW